MSVSDGTVNAFSQWLLCPVLGVWSQTEGTSLNYICQDPPTRRTFFLNCLSNCWTFFASYFLNFLQDRIMSLIRDLVYIAFSPKTWWIFLIVEAFCPRFFFPKGNLGVYLSWRTQLILFFWLIHILCFGVFPPSHYRTPQPPRPQSFA